MNKQASLRIKKERMLYSDMVAVPRKLNDSSKLKTKKATTPRTSGKIILLTILSTNLTITIDQGYKERRERKVKENVTRLNRNF